MEVGALFRKEEGPLSGMRKAWPLWCFFGLMLLSLAPLLIDVIPQRDVAFRYAPMAEAFRDGDFIYAFHPRTGFLHTLTAGLFAWLLQCGGFTACKLSSLLFMGLSLFPLYALMKRVYSRTMAEICTFIYVLGSQLQRLGWSGLRDSHKVFLVVLAAYALIVIFQERKNWKGYLWLGVSVGFGVVTRGDLVLFMSLLSLWGTVQELRIKQFPLRSAAGTVLAVLLAMPAILLNWYLAGVAVPEIRFAWIFKKVMHRYPGLTDTLPLLALSIVCGFLAAWGIRKILDAGFGRICAWLAAVLLAAALIWRGQSPDFYVEESVASYLGAIFKGFFPVFAVTGLAGIYYRLTRKEWTREESILAGILFGHAILVCSQIVMNDCFLYVSPRYLEPAVPLEFGWSVTGILFWWALLTARIRETHPLLIQRVGCIAFALTICGFLYDFYNPVIREYTTAKWTNYRQGLHRIADIIRRDYRGPAEFRPEVDPNVYIPKRNPAVLYMAYRERRQEMWSDFGRVIISTYLLRGRVVGTVREADYIVEKRTDKVDFPQYAEKNWKKVKLVLIGETEVGKERYRVWKKVY